MRILQVHNRYKQLGGEDVVVHAERRLLEAYGNQVEVFETNNSEIVGLARKIGTAFSTIYSFGSKGQVQERIEEFKPDIVHVHNFFPLISPSVYYACRETGVPVVQTLHNYRLICPNAQLLRKNRLCEDCVGKAFAWPGILHRCYRDSFAGTAIAAGMLAIHRGVGTWTDAVHAFIATTEFSRGKMIEGGLPSDKLFVKPNFVPYPCDTLAGSHDYALFVGRLSPEKGIGSLLSAWDELESSFHLKVAGDGPLRDDVKLHETGGRIEYLGTQTPERIQSLMCGAAFLIVPSVCYEGLPLVILEAFSVGLPVISSDHGGMACLVKNGHTGLFFRPGDVVDIAAKVDWAISHLDAMRKMGQNARREYLRKYTPERNYEMLVGIYQRTISSKIGLA